MTVWRDRETGPVHPSIRSAPSIVGVIRRIDDGVAGGRIFHIKVGVAGDEKLHLRIAGMIGCEFLKAGVEWHRCVRVGPLSGKASLAEVFKRPRVLNQTEQID